MIKVLFLIEKLNIGGAEKVLRDLVNHMDQTKFEITVRSLWPYEEGKMLSKGIKYKPIYPSYNKLTNLLYRIGSASGFLYQFHIDKHYDLECAFIEAGPTKILSTSTNKKAKKLAWVHCDLMRAVADINSFKDKTCRWYENYNRVVCVSEQVKTSFDTIFDNRFHSDVVHNVVEDEIIRRKSEEPLDIKRCNQLIVLASGSLYPPKNYPRLLKAHKRILAEGINHQLWILGDGFDRKTLEEYIQKNDLQNTVTLFGFQQNPYKYMKAADIIACSSNYEGFSTVITESTILGKPIVTTDCSGMKEILGDSEFGMVTENDDESFYEGLKQMITDPVLRKHYAEQSAMRGKDFSMEKLVRQVEDYLMSVVNTVD